MFLVFICHISQISLLHDIDPPPLHVVFSFITQTPIIAKTADLDQVLLVMGEKLGKILPFVGGPDQAHSLIPILEALCEIEEVTVRNTAAVSVGKIIQQLSPNHASQVTAYFELLKRMSNEELGELFYTRVSSCKFVPDLYRVLGEADKIALREIYTRLCKDELPIVRRAASYIFINMAKLADAETLGGEYLNLFKSLIADESQTIQVVAIESMHEFGKLLKTNNNATAISNVLLPLVKQFAEDPSWKLRQSLSKNYGLFATSFLPVEVTTEVFPALMHLIQDPDPEVRTIAILEVLPYLSVVGTSMFISELAPAAVQLADDPMVLVRKLLAELCVDVAAKVGPEAVAAHLSDLVIKLMEDDDPLVRLRILKKMGTIAEEAPSLCTRLTEYLKALFSNANWRVRKELVVAMPSIVKHMGPEYFIDHFHLSFLALLKDGVGEVRVTAAAACPRISAAVNAQWGYEKLFPSVREMATDGVAIRISMMAGLGGFLDLELSDKFFNEVSGLLLAGANDKVPNVRMAVAQALFGCSTKANLSSSQQATLQTALDTLKSDKDRDVKYAATFPTPKAAHI